MISEELLCQLSMLHPMIISFYDTCCTELAISRQLSCLINETESLIFPSELSGYLFANVSMPTALIFMQSFLYLGINHPLLSQKGAARLLQ